MISMSCDPQNALDKDRKTKNMYSSGQAGHKTLYGPGLQLKVPKTP